MNGRRDALKALTRALAMSALFHAGALILVGGFLYAPFAGHEAAGQVDLWVACCCVVAAGAIAWVVVPRSRSAGDHQPWVRLQPEDHPSFFEVLEDVAQRTGLPMPDEVYLDDSCMARLRVEVGWLGFTCRRSLGLGLPLLQVQPVAELRAVLAHELSHGRRGTIWCGNVIQRTREALERAVQALQKVLPTRILRPARCYGSTIHRLWLTFARHQELAADTASADIAGRRAAIVALKRITLCTLAHWEFRHNHFLPVLSESLLVAAWVGMWRPIQMLLYDWWPIRRRIAVFERLAHATVDVRPRTAARAH